MRISYNSSKERFIEDHVKVKEPYSQFESWFKDATNCERILEPNSMFLATSNR